ncbi:MAG: CsbA family protein [Staphylococcus lugdunensis]|nr:CsbA family protein [Staphylococcus lugdunensis]
MIWYVCAALFPCLLVVLFSVVTRNKWIGTLVALILIATSIYKGFFHNELIIFLDVVSLLAGYVIIDNLKLHQSHDND